MPAPKPEPVRRTWQCQECGARVALAADQPPPDWAQVGGDPERWVCPECRRHAAAPNACGAKLPR
ncbi:MAG: hypothetical protein KQJ78_14680 [Deltaproteobacteria bacterium]|nr:hypothetical protein [Deltaproteobacteria bacterium]